MKIIVRDQETDEELTLLGELKLSSGLSQHYYKDEFGNYLENTLPPFHRYELASIYVGLGAKLGNRIVEVIKKLED